MVQAIDRRRLVGWTAAACGASSSGVRAQRPPITPLRVVYPRPPREVDETRWYPLQLLRRVLQASEVPHRIEPSQHVIVQERAIRELAADGDAVSLVWTVTSAERERLLRPVRIPIDRGLFGWRLLLLRRGEASRFAQVRSLNDLQRFVLLQGDEWPDTQVLRASGLQVNSTSSLLRLFEMLRRGEGDAFPRSVEEIWGEATRYAPAFEVEPQLALRYPSAFYYFTAPGNAPLAQALERGLDRLRANGDFQRLFLAHHGELLQRAGMEQRRVLTLRNPLLDGVRLPADPHLWWQPGETAPRR